MSVQFRIMVPIFTFTTWVVKLVVWHPYIYWEKMLKPFWLFGFGFTFFFFLVPSLPAVVVRCIC